jgi:hypothetical protein
MCVITTSAASSYVCHFPFRGSFVYFYAFDTRQVRSHPHSLCKNAGATLLCRRRDLSKIVVNASVPSLSLLPLLW